MPVIAVDGPAGSGKSSVCRGVAERLGLRYLDTGAMYRAMTWAMIESGVDVDDADAVASAASDVTIVSGTDPRQPTIHVGDIDVSGPIRGDAVTEAVSAVSAVPSVRQRLVALQRDEVAAAREAGAGIIVEGRDITTVVLPDADLKVFVTADAAVRARRRAIQDVTLGKEDVDVDRTESALRARDTKDSSRAASPLAQAQDAVLLDTTDLSLDQVVDQLVGMVEELPRT
ncbi:MAG TPA: (d)CMP kinase [Actinobacteria bacterium]|jgi:cytidylate kinase|nr:(d)CMP kinase [Actinomycetota bacterium]